MKDTYN